MFVILFPLRAGGAVRRSTNNLLPLCPPSLSPYKQVTQLNTSRFVESRRYRKFLKIWSIVLDGRIPNFTYFLDKMSLSCYFTFPTARNMNNLDQRGTSPKSNQFKSLGKWSLELLFDKCAVAHKIFSIQYSFLNSLTFLWNLTDQNKNYSVLYFLLQSLSVKGKGLFYSSLIVNGLVHSFGSSPPLIIKGPVLWVTQ